MTQTQQSTYCSIEAGDVKQYLLLWRYDVQTDERDCHGNAASTPLCYDLLRPTHVQIPQKFPETCRLLQRIYRRRSWNLATRIHYINE